MTATSQPSATSTTTVLTVDPTNLGDIVDGDEHPLGTGANFESTKVTTDQDPNGSLRTSGSSLAFEGTQTPDPLFRREGGLSNAATVDHYAGLDGSEGTRGVVSQKTAPHIGEPLENVARTLSRPPQAILERGRPSQQFSVSEPQGLATETGSPTNPISQGVPPELPNFQAEIVFVLVCSASQLLFGWLLGDTNVNQAQLQKTLAIKNTDLPWIQGAFNTANGLSIILSGSITDLAPPKMLMVGAFAWLTVWNIVGAFSLTPARAILFFIVRAMQGLAIGVLASGSMSILGRVYKPGRRKTQVFSSMAAMAPFGYWLGAITGGALTYHLPWLFGTNAILCALLSVAAFLTIPQLKPAADIPGAEAPSLRQFDYIGAIFAVFGSICLLFGLTQGSVVDWSPYTYSLTIAGVLLLIAFFFVEGRVSRPLVPNRLWTTRGFAPLMIAYFLGFGSFIAWQFYALQFWLRIQGVSPLTAALYFLPNAIVGVLAVFIVSRVMHIVPGHWIYAVSMVAFSLGPAFFLGQTPDTVYWALSMPGVALTTFGPDLSFAAASIFITSNVARSYQGSAGSMLMTGQNLASAIMTSLADAIGSQVDLTPEGEVGLKGLKAIWWFTFGSSLLGALITAVWVRIPKEEEKEHVT